jgi:hypothetical protein
MLSPIGPAQAGSLPPIKKPKHEPRNVVPEMVSVRINLKNQKDRNFLDDVLRQTCQSPFNTKGDFTDGFSVFTYSGRATLNNRLKEADGFQNVYLPTDFLTTPLGRTMKLPPMAAPKIEIDDLTHSANTLADFLTVSDAIGVKEAVAVFKQANLSIQNIILEELRFHHQLDNSKPSSKVEIKVQAFRKATEKVEEALKVTTLTKQDKQAVQEILTTILKPLVEILESFVAKLIQAPTVEKKESQQRHQLQIEISKMDEDKQSRAEENQRNEFAEQNKAAFLGTANQNGTSADSTWHRLLFNGQKTE